MKKLFLLFVILAPSTTSAALQNLEMVWDQYYDGTAILHIYCKESTQPDAAYAVQYDNISALLVVSPEITFNADPGQTVRCQLWASNSVTASPPAIADYLVPPTAVLPIPTGVILRKKIP